MLELNGAFEILDKKIIFSFCGKKKPADSYIIERHVCNAVLRLFREITSHTFFTILER